MAKALNRFAQFQRTGYPFDVLPSNPKSRRFPRWATMIRDGANSRNSVGCILEARLEPTDTPSSLPTASLLSLFHDNILANTEAEVPFSLDQAAACTRNTLKLNRPRRQGRAHSQRSPESFNYHELVRNRLDID